jgi:hypothetical protein
LEPRALLTAIPITSVPDTTPPQAQLVAPAVTNPGTDYTFEVVYTDAGSLVKLSTLGSQNLCVTGPWGFDQFATLVDAGGTADASTLTATYSINAPNGAWNTLDNNGIFTVSIAANQVSDAAGNFISAGSLGTFPVDLGSPANYEEVVQPGGSGFWQSDPSTWTAVQRTDVPCYVSSTPNGSKQSQAAWWFTMPAGVYEIDATWTASSNLTPRLGLDLYDGTQWVGQIQVNEQQAPSDIYDNLGLEEHWGLYGWKRLGSIRLTGNDFHISTWNDATDGAIAVGAIRLVNQPIVDNSDNFAALSPFPHPEAMSAFSAAGPWATAGGFEGSSLTSTGDPGSCTATWTMPVTPGWYAIDVNWQPANGLSANAAYDVYDGTTKVGSATINQQQPPPTGLPNEDYPWWVTLGRFNITGNLLRVVVSNAATDGQVSADAIQIQPGYQPVPVVGNGDSGFWSNGNWMNIQAGFRAGAMVSSSANGDKQSQAAWWFSCPPGQYEVDVTWQPGASYSQNVGFDVYDGQHWLGQSRVDEQDNPTGVDSQGVVWQSLGVFTATGNTLHVSTWNSATDGAICIDAVRIVPVGGSAAMLDPQAVDQIDFSSLP